MKNLKKILVSIVLLISLFFIGSSVHFRVAPTVALGATNAIPTPIALFQTSLASGITSTATSMTLVSGTDKDGNPLSGTYAFIVDEGTANEEFVNADCVSTACTNMSRGLSVVTGTTSITALKHEHRRGSSVKITDAPQLLILHRIINGISTFPNKLSYTTHPTFSSDTEIVDKKYVADSITGFTGTATTTTAGTSKISVTPASPGNPIAVGDNDPRVPTIAQVGYIPTTTQKDALVGTSGTPSSSNKYVTNADTTSTPTANAVVRFDSSGNTPGVTTSYTYGESISLGQPVYLKASDGKVYKASAATATEALNGYIGIAGATGVLNDVKPVYTQEGAVVTGLSFGASTGSVTSTQDFAMTTGTTSLNPAIYTGTTSPSIIFISGKKVSNISSFDVRVGQTGTGGGTLTATLVTFTPNGGAGGTYGSSLGTVSIVSPVQNAVNTFTFSSPITISPNTMYALLFTANNGNASNYWSLQGTTGAPGNYQFYSDQNTSASSIATGSFYFANYYTATQNWQIGDNVYLSDTSGTLDPTLAGTNPFVVGRILSATSMQLYSPKGDRLISTNFIPKFLSDNAGAFTYSLFPTPKNATRFVVSINTTGTTPPRYGQLRWNISEEASLTGQSESQQNAAAASIDIGSTGVNNNLRTFGKLQQTTAAGSTAISNGSIISFFR